MLLTPDDAKRLAAALLDEPNAGDLPLHVPRADPRPLPERIGDYRILGVIASGGMGVVYEAQQDQPKRSVALKVMKRGIASPKALERFKHEAEILGRLRHPAIAQVYEAGTHDDGSGGVPFFVMEYIPKARPITRYADDSKLSIRGRLDLFAEVCDGVHHGHQHGIIHRDLKPHNILVDETGQPKIIDFGVARATDSDIALTTMHADVRQLVGTLQYMSPEQCGGDPSEIDTRSDVYSLGVVLYELLCGRLPYDLSETPIPHATRVIQEQDPPRPRTVCKTLWIQRALEAIILKSLEKDRQHRYQSAAALADDVRRYQRGEPVEAGVASPWIRAVKWVARHPMATTAAACLGLVALTGASIFVGVQWIALQPTHFVWPDRSTAHLQSRGGVTLATLGGTSRSSVQVATDAPRPEDFGGGRMALFSVSGMEGENLTGGQLFVTPIADLKRVIWQTEPAAPYIVAPGQLAFARDTYAVTDVCVANVFGDRDHPGDEIITIHNCEGRSPSAIRIYDWNRNLLFEAWHLGPIFDVRWVHDMHLLVCTGDRHGIDWARANAWIRENESAESVDLGQGDFPRIVFALAPVAGKRVAWLNDVNDSEASSVVRWYRCMRPLYTAKDYWLLVHDALRRYPGCVHLQVALRDGGGVLSLLVDENGTLKERDSTDEFTKLLGAGRVPPASTFDIRDLPPITKSMREIEDIAAEEQRAAPGAASKPPSG